MQTAGEKTFHLKWNNHLQNLSQLFTTIYSSNSLADVTLSCRDGSIHAHKLVLSACSPYFEQIFKENPCKHPTIILKGIPYAEINLLVEFMYKGSVDVQEIDLQSLMHTASELEIRGLAYEVRKDAASLLNVNLNEYPNFPGPAGLGQDNPFPPGFDPGSVATSSPYNSTPRQVNPYQTNLERLRQIHMYQQAMCRNQGYTAPTPPTTTAPPQLQPDLTSAKRKKKNEDHMPPNTTTAVKNILAAAAKEMENKKSTKTSTCIQTEDDIELVNMAIKNEEIDLDDTPAHGRDTRFKGRKRVSVGMDDSDYSPMPSALSKNKSGLDGSIEKRSQGLKCVSFQDLKEKPMEHNENQSVLESSIEENNLLMERGYKNMADQEDEYDSSDNKSEGTSSKAIYKCDLCDQRYTRNSHMIRHRRSHTGVRPFKCTSCHYSFTRSSHLARHRRTHTGERPFRCEACGRCFARGDKLKLHMKICEKDEYVAPGISNNSQTAVKSEESGSKPEVNAMTSGMVSIEHSERHHLMFTPSGDVMLAPRGQESNDASLNDTTCQSDASATSPSLTTSKTYSDKDYPIKRGRGRPRKKPLPPVETTVIKKRRGRPPKIIKIEPSESTNARSMEIYNPSNLPYGDFSYLTDIISTHFNQSTQQAYQNMLQLNPMLAVNALQGALSSQAGLPSLMPQALQTLENLKNQASLQEKINSAISAQLAHHSVAAMDKPKVQEPTAKSLPDDVDDTDKPNDLSTRSEQVSSVDLTTTPITNENGDEDMKSPEAPPSSSNSEEMKTTSVSEDVSAEDSDPKVITTGEIQISAISENCKQVPEPQVKSLIPNLNDCTIQPISQKD